MSSSIPSFGSGDKPSWNRPRPDDRDLDRDHSGSSALNSSSIYQQNDSSRPVDTPPNGSLSFSSGGLQFGNSTNNARNSAVHSTPATSFGRSGNAMFGQHQQQPSGGLFSTSKATSATATANVSFSTPSTMSTPTTFGSRSNSNNPSSNPITQSSFLSQQQQQHQHSSHSNLGLRQRNVNSNSNNGSDGIHVNPTRPRGFGFAPPPKRSMMTMSMEHIHMNVNNSSTSTSTSTSNFTSTNNSKGTGRTAAPAPSLTNEDPMHTLDILDRNMLLNKENINNRTMDTSSSLDHLSIFKGKSSASDTTAAAAKNARPQSLLSSTSKSSTAGSAPMEDNKKKHLNYNQWVVLYGFTTSAQYSTVMTNFESYGTILSKYPSTPRTANGHEPMDMSTNWVCIQYQSALQADKALCQHGSLLDAHAHGHQSSSTTSSLSVPMIVGVMKMDAIVADKLGLRKFLMEGSSGIEQIGLGWNLKQSSSSGDSGSASVTNRHVHGSASAWNENDVLLGNEARGGGDGSGGRGGGGIDVDMVRKDGVCYKLLSWVFEW